MSTTPVSPLSSTSQFRERTHAMWDSVADEWGRLAGHVDERGASVSEAMLAIAHPQSGDDVLELACGAGGLGLAAAPMVGSTGSVLLSDVAPRMVEVARERVRGLPELAWVGVGERDLEEIDDPEGSYDVVLCREGLMFATDTDRACREIHRVLRPQGRAAIAVWGAPADNQWLALVMEAASDELGAPVPPPGIPGPLGLGDPSALRDHLQRAGLEDVTVQALSCDLDEPTFDSYWEHRVGLAGPLAVRLRGVSTEVADRLRERVRAAVEPYRVKSGLHFPGLALVASGRKA